MATPNLEDRLATALLIMRLSIAILFYVWVADKLFSPETSSRVFQAFYFSAPSYVIINTLGAIQFIIVTAFAAGFMKFYSYGAILLMHSVSTISTVERLADPLARPNILFWAAVPVLGAILALFLLRDHDTKFSAGRARADSAA